MRVHTLVPEPDFVSGPPEPAATAGKPDAAEFELVLGKRQVASLSFVALVVLALSSGGAYLIGRFAGPAAQSAPEPPPVALAPAAAAAAPEPPLYGTPLKGPIYIQMGAVEKGTATLLTHGLRKLGYNAFIAEGTNNKIFRVLVGPFQNAAEYETARRAFQQLGLDNFSRRYEE